MRLPRKSSPAVTTIGRRDHLTRGNSNIARYRVGDRWQIGRMELATNRASNDALVDLVRPDRLTSVVDIGANPIDGDPPYKAMLQRRICRLIGFDPQPDALTRLNACKTDLETYLPYAVG